MPFQYAPSDVKKKTPLNAESLTGKATPIQNARLMPLVEALAIIASDARKPATAIRAESDAMDTVERNGVSDAATRAVSSSRERSEN